MSEVSNKESAFGALAEYAKPALIPFESCMSERVAVEFLTKKLIDTNVILRSLLKDNEEQSQIADEIINEGAWSLPEVLAEVDHVLRTFYHVDRKSIARQLFTVLNLIDVEPREVIFRAIKIFADTKLDFVDCILVAYHDVENIDVFTFDKDLNKQLKRED